MRMGRALDDKEPNLTRVFAMSLSATGSSNSSGRREREDCSFGPRWAQALGMFNESAKHGGKAVPPTRQLPAFVVKVEQFCQGNLSQPIGVKDMSRVANLSRCHFSREFVKARGVSPGRYLAGLRLEKARRLAVAGEFTVKKISGLCGFEDANYFCKVFRKNFGVSPGVFRARRRNQTQRSGRPSR